MPRRERRAGIAIWPTPPDQIHDPQFERLVATLCDRSDMFLAPTYLAACAYLEGFNQARNGGPLIGLHQWLVVRANGGENREWRGLAREQLVIDPADANLPEEVQAVRALGRLLGEFFEYRRANGLSKIFHDYARWLLRHRWYSGPLRENKPAKA